MGKRVRRQHLVSKFYLKGFANEANQLRRILLPGDRSHLIAISDATVIKDFYTIPLPDGTQSDAFERKFADIEEPASKSLRAVRNDHWPLHNEDRISLATWIALQHLRCENIRLSGLQYEAMTIRLIVGVSGKQALRTLIENAEQRTISTAELDWEWQDLTKPGGPDLMPRVTDHLKLLTDMHGNLSAYLLASHWSLINFTRRPLLTTDQPVVMSAGPDYPRHHGVGLATADAFIASLTRYKAIVIQPWLNGVPPGHHRPDISVPGTTVMARSINQELARQALRHLYTHPDDDLTSGLHLPQPDRRQWDSVDADQFIHEDGFFHGVDPATLKSLAKSTPRNNAATSFSIADLSWPIPGRLTPNKPTTW